MELKICCSFFLIIILGLIVHLLFGYSMFDIFFKFPLNYGMTPHSPELSDDELPSNRVALLVLDGARADSFFEAASSGKSPFLRDIIENRGVYGISHTKVPTETKPGFTAICSGHFEDASLALEGLSSRTVLTDSIFNESVYALGVGHDSCMFGDVAKHMYCAPFSSEENFNDKSAEESNYKVFDTMIDILNKAKKDNNSEIYKNLNKKKTSFLFHLVQTDVIGHSDGPKSERLMNHLITLDKYYEKLEQAFNDFYKDNKTTFIITADHGMDLRNAHGDGHPDCTRTPFVIWGAGIRKAIYREKKPQEEDTPSNWELDKVVRKDISQIDITPLASGLIGTKIPMNSIGVMPLDILDIPDKVKSKLIFANFMELFEIYTIKNEIANKSIVFKPFKHLIDSDKHINDILEDINNENYIDAINKTQILINMTLDGIDYILHYDRLYLKTVISTGYILWILYIFIFIEMKKDNKLNKLFFYNREENLFLTIISGIITIILCIYLMIRLSPIIYYLYTLFPCYFFWRILVNLQYLKKFFIKESSLKSNLKNFIGYILLIIGFLSIVSLYYFNLNINNI